MRIFPISLLSQCKRLETSMRKAGVPAMLACLPMWLLSLNYYWMLRDKTASMSRVCTRIEGWLATVKELSSHEKGRAEFIDLDRKMRGDIEGAAHSMRGLCSLCLEIHGMFAAVGYRSALLDGGRKQLSEAVDKACALSQTLLDAVDAHDRRALSIRQQLHAIEQASVASAAAQAARA